MVLKRVGNDNRRTKRVTNDILKTGEPYRGRRYTEKTGTYRGRSLYFVQVELVCCCGHICVCPAFCVLEGLISVSG